MALFATCRWPTTGGGSMSTGWCLLLSVTAACGGVKSLADAQLPSDAPRDMPRMCDPTKPFGPPTVVANINSSSRDVDAVLANELTIYWASDRSGGSGLDLYLATRTSRASSFTNPTSIVGLNGPGAELAPFLTGDELTMYYAFAAMGQTTADICATKRADVASAFPLGTAVAQIN